jgi:hypothetical protein
LGAVQSAAFAARVRVERRRMLLNFILVDLGFGALVREVLFPVGCCRLFILSSKAKVSCHPV